MRSLLAILLACAALAVVLALANCERSAGSSNGAGKPTPATGTPRIVALSPAAAICLRDLGLESSIVGRHNWDMVLPKSVPVCGDQSGLDFEAIVKTQPTHVVLQWGQRELPAPLRSLSDEGRWAIINFNPLSLDDIIKSTAELERVFQPAPDRRGLADRMRAAIALRTGLDAAGRVMLLESSSPPAALGPGSCHHDILLRIGGRSAFKDEGSYLVLHTEDVLRYAPDAIILIQPRDRDAPAGAPAGATRDPIAFLGPIASLDIPAVRNKRVAIIDDPLALTPSSAMIDFANDLAAHLERWSR